MPFELWYKIVIITVHKMFSYCVEFNILSGIPEDAYPLKNVYYVMFLYSPYIWKGRQIKNSTGKVHFSI